MAKISANGNEKAAAWRNAEGCRLVLRSDGALLRNYLKGDGLSITRKRVSLEQAQAYAQALGFERVNN